MTSPDFSAQFVALWNAQSRRVYAYIYSLVGDWADADDIFQETGLVAFAKFNEFEHGTNFGAWACRIAYYKALQQLRQQQLEPHLDEDVLEALHEESLAVAEETTLRVAALNDCLKQLPRKDRRLIELRYHGEQSVEILALKSDRSTSAIYKGLSRIHEVLLDCISGKLARENRS